MILSIEKNTFADIVHKAARFAEKGSATLPVLSSLLLVASDDGVKLRATNLEISADLKMKAEGKKNGVLAIPARILEQVASSFAGDGTITLEQNGEIVVLKSGATKLLIKTVPYEDFPVLSIPESLKGRIILPGSVLKNLFSSISSCASTSTIRPELASVFISIEGDSLTAVATDSFRLAEKKIPLPGKSGQHTLLLPAKNVLEIIQALPDDEVIMSFDEHQCAFIFEGGTLMTRLTSAAYPDYQQIIPKESVAEAVLLRKDLDLALKRATIFSDAFQKIKLSFDPKHRQLNLFSKNPDIGESSESITGQVSGSTIDLSFNHRYLQAFFPLTTAESVSLTASGIGRPLIARGVGDASLLYLVMPMNQ